MTEVAPYAGRRARREAENRPEGRRHVAAGHPIPEAGGLSGQPNGQVPYSGSGPRDNSITAFWPQAGQPVTAAPQTGYLPQTATDGRETGYAPAGGYEQPAPTGYEVVTEYTPNGRAAPTGYTPPGYATPNGYTTPTGYTTPSGYAPDGYAQQGYAQQGHAPNGYSPAAPREVRSINMTPGSPAAPSDSSMRGRHATQWDQGFGRVIGWTLAGILLPGAGLIAAGRRVIGGLVLAVCLLSTLAAVGLVLLGDPISLVAAQVLAHPERLTYAAAAIALLGVLWAVYVIGTHASLRRFAELTGSQRMLAFLLVSTLASGGLGGALYGGKQVLLGRDTLDAIFAGSPLSALSKRPNTSGSVADPWAGTPRINLLLIGSDAGADRTGLRTDTLIVASLDTRTGETVLFSIPRNLEHVPFPAGSQQAVDYPEGFSCPEHACMINALWQFGAEHKSTYYRGEKNAGLTATVQGVQETLGLTIDNYAMVDLRGFMQFVDAIGGLTINVPRKIPVGGHRDPASGVQTGVTSYIKPGRQLLNGYESLWFARSRSDSDDFERMRRQRCVIGAVTQQADPQTVALHLSAILKAAKDNIRTSIPVSDIDAWVTLSLKVKKAHVRSLAFTDAVINSGQPDFYKMHELVQKAQETPPPASKPAATASPSPSASATAKHTTPKPSATVAEDPNTAVDVNAVC